VSLSDATDSTSGTLNALLDRPFIWKTAFAMVALPAVENSVTDPNFRNSDYLFEDNVTILQVCSLKKRKKA
jgi:hypothetical protein